MLYDGVRREIETHLKTVAASVTSLSGLQLLQTLSKEWTQHTKVMGMISDVLMYMVCVHCPSTLETYSAGAGCLACLQIPHSHSRAVLLLQT